MASDSRRLILVEGNPSDRVKQNVERSLGVLCRLKRALDSVGNACSSRYGRIPGTVQPSRSLCSCFKIFGLYERARGVHKLYGCSAPRQRRKRATASRNIMSRRLFPPWRKTPPIKHTNCGMEVEERRGKGREDLSDEFRRRIEYSLNTFRPTFDAAKCPSTFSAHTRFLWRTE